MACSTSGSLRMNWAEKPPTVDCRMIDTVCVRSLEAVGPMLLVGRPAARVQDAWPASPGTCCTSHTKKAGVAAGFLSLVDPPISGAEPALRARLPAQPVRPL